MNNAASLPAGALAALVLLLLGGSAALSIDVVDAGYGIKGDEATYVAMALSAAYDGDLAYERGVDLDRFYRFYPDGPRGIFLKRGREAAYRLDQSFPFLHRDTRRDPSADRLYFGKAFAHALAAAPFVRVAGLNGLLLFHVVLGALICLAGVAFVAARSPTHVALLFTLAFFGASIAPLYMVWLTSDFFNLALVFYACFLWFYKAVAPPAAGRWAGWLRGPYSDLAAAALLGVAAYSKPPSLLLIAPPLVWLIGQRQVARGAAVCSLFVLTMAGAFAANAAITGEFNYQGGERRIYYGTFPFAANDIGFEEGGVDLSTNPESVGALLGGTPAAMTLHNVLYFFVGRHFGLLPYFFPGVVTILLALISIREWRLWRGCVLAAVMVGAITLVVLLPYSWSGGGGPTGNRYFLSLYPALFFVVPPLQSGSAALAALSGGALFTAHILASPFVSAKNPDITSQRGLLRLLPIELTMADHLPLTLHPSRTRVPYGDDPQLFLYFVDSHAFLPEPPGIWVAGASRADIIVRTYRPPPLTAATIELRSPITNTVSVSFGSASQRVTLQPGVPVTLSFVPDGMPVGRSWVYLLTVSTSGGFVPRMIEPGSRDTRYLGVAVTVDGIIE